MALIKNVARAVRALNISYSSRGSLGSARPRMVPGPAMQSTVERSVASRDAKAGKVAACVGFIELLNSRR